MLSGDNSILSKTTTAKENTDSAQIKERIQLAELSAITSGEGNLTYPKLNEELTKEFGAKGTGYNISDESENPWKITVEDVEYNISHAVAPAIQPGESGYAGGYYDDPYIPINFEHKAGTTTDWNSGYTIIGKTGTDNAGDEFVWVPCVLDQSTVKNGDTVQNFTKITTGKYNSSLTLHPSGGTNGNVNTEDATLESIINQLGETINYNQDGYVGEYILNTQNIQIKTNYNGYREDLIEETINYTSLSRNDLDFIPKQKVKNGLTLDLLNIEWEVETTKMIGEYEVADLYTAKCYYAGKQRIDYPNTYTVTAEYTGKATKEILRPYKYTIKYNKLEEKTPEPEVIEEKDSIVLPIASGTTGIVLVVLFFFTRNVTVYNYKDDKFVKVGKTRINRNNTINLTRFSLFEKTNKYKLEFSRGLTHKMQGKMMTIRKENNKVKMLVNTNEEKYSVETRL